MRIRDGAGALKTVSSVRMRDGSNALKSAKIRMRDGANVLKSAFTSGGGGGPPPGGSISILPPNFSSSDSRSTQQHDFTASFSGGTATDIVWSIISGPGSVKGGQGTATAKIQNAPPAESTGVVTILCTATINGVSRQASATYTYERTA